MEEANQAHVKPNNVNEKALLYILYAYKLSV